MARRGDNAPIGHTCPKIDSVISIIHSVYTSSEEMSRQEYTEFEKLMEEIRSANSTLREWGNEHYERSEEMEKDYDYTKDRLADAESEIFDLKKEIKELENNSVD
jgi:polyhydroxyalkanoate synthesis regulator phasin